MAEAINAAASVTAPGAGAALVTIAAGLLIAGKYRIKVDASVSGAAVADLGNLRLRRGGVDLVSPIPAGANGEVADWVLDEVNFDGTQNLTVEAIGAGTAAIEYNVQVEALRVGGI